MFHDYSAKVLKSASIARSKRIRQRSPTPRNQISINYGVFVRLAKRKLEANLNTDAGKICLQEEAKLYGGDEVAAKQAIFELLEKRISQKMRKLSQKSLVKNHTRRARAVTADVITAVCSDESMMDNEQSTKRPRASTAPAVMCALQKWVVTIREDPRCQTVEFCEVLRAVGDCMQRSLRANKVPDYIALRSAVMQRCKLMASVFGDHHDKYIRELADAVRESDH